MSYRNGLAALCGATLISIAGCGGGSSGGDSGPAVPAAPSGVTAAPGNAQATISWPAVQGATSYNVYTSSSVPVTAGGTKTSVGTPGATLSSLANGTPVFAAVTAVNSAGESALSQTVCAMPTAASTAGLTLYDPLCSSTLDGRKWQTPLFNRRVENGALVLSSEISNMESRSIQGQVYMANATVDAGAQRVSALKADIAVPAATASRTGNAEIRAMVQIAYQPPDTRLVFPGNLLNALFIQVGLADTGGGLRAFRRVLHCDNASCTPRSPASIAFSDPAGFAPNANGLESDAAAAYDTSYTVSASLDESTGIFHWSIAGGAFGAGVSGTADPSAYLAGNSGWTALGANPLAGPGFFTTFLRAQVLDESPLAGSTGRVTASFRNVQVGFNNAAATLWDDFSGTGGNSGPAELSRTKWTTPGKDSVVLAAGSLAGHAQATSLASSSVADFQALNLSDPAAGNTLQADVTVSACSGSLPGTNRVGLAGEFYNDGTPGTTPPNINQPNSRTGDISASLFLDCIAGVARWTVTRFDTQTGQTLLSNFANSTILVGSAIVGNTHTLTMRWDPAGHLFTFQVDGGTPVAVDPTTANANMLTAAPYVKPANAPLRQLFWFVSVPAGVATASVDFTANNVFTAP